MNTAFFNLQVYTVRAMELAGGRVFGDSMDGVTHPIFLYPHLIRGRQVGIIKMAVIVHFCLGN